MSTLYYEVRMIAASITPWGDKIATIVARYPRFIHGELMTHKDLSRNASSSRAIPFKTMLRLVRKDMAAPLHWGANQPGMQANTELTGHKRAMAVFMWHLTGHVVLSLAWLMSFTGVHKQVINRMIEPWSYINVQITATNWDRMLKLRLDPAAQPEFRQLALQIQSALKHATYLPLREGEWHVPWIMADEMRQVSRDVNNKARELSWQLLKKLSAARSARLSYTPVGDVKRSNEKDLTLACRLIDEKHLSPFEHQATPCKGQHANLKGWMNYRNQSLEH
jgi:hypothetical protein